jgi:hypothetical protein
MQQVNIYFRGSKRQKKAFRAQKTEFGAQNQYGRVIYPLSFIDREFYMEQEKIYFLGPKR